MKARHLVFTVNNYTEETVNALEKLPCKYMIFGYEDQGTPHLQGYVCFKTPRRFGTMAKRFGAHFEVMRGTPVQAIEYCKKEGNFIERGEIPIVDGGQCEKERWANNIKLAEEGKLEELKILDPQAYTRCYSTYQKIQVQALKPIGIFRECFWYVGRSGTGKSRKAFEENPEAFWKESNKWWDGYNGQMTVIIDDLEKDARYMGHFLKRWGDRYPVTGELKGSTVSLVYNKLIVTSNYRPEDIWDDQVLVEAILRRFNIVSFD